VHSRVFDPASHRVSHVLLGEGHPWPTVEIELPDLIRPR
jgi:hypothetical protein